MTTKRKLIVAAGAVATVVIAGILGRSVFERSVRAEFVVANRGAVYQTILANGRVAGSRVTTLSFMRNGIVERILVREGAAVFRGDTLVLLDNRQETNELIVRRNALEATRVNIEKLMGPELRQAHEQLGQAQAELQNLEARVERLEKLFVHGAVSQQELENARTQRELARSRVAAAESRVSSLSSAELRLLQLQRRQAEAALREATIAMSRGVLRAPENGKIVRVHVNEGQLVGPGVAVLSFLPDDTTTHVELQVDESQAGRVRAGQRVLVTSRSLPDSLWTAYVSEVVPIVDAARGTITVKVAFDRASNALIADQTVAAQIVTDTIADAVVLEQRFVESGTRPQNVMVLRKGRAVQLEVTTRDVGGGRLQILSGVVPGDTVLFAAALKPGDRVRVMGRETAPIRTR